MSDSRSGDLVIPDASLSAFGAVREGVERLMVNVEGAMKNAGVTTIGKNPSELN